jgi:DNA mismatch endonuclease (patch repair protein)
VPDYPHPSSAGRSANMRANRRTDTKPELALRRALRKVAVFVDGCFWHACPEHGSKPRNNDWYWGPKLVRNVERDRANDAALILAGWSVVRLWEHVPLEAALDTVVTALTATSKAAPRGELPG